MSVATTTSKIQYTLTTGSQALAVPFYFLENSHVKAIRVATDTLPKADLVLGTDYTLTGAGNPAGGTLTTIATVGNGLAAGSKVVIKRNLPITQPTSYSPNDAFPAKVHEAALDRGIMIAQQSDEQSGRAIRFPEDDSTSSELPAVADRASKAIGFNASGALEMKTVVGADGILEDESVGEDALQGAFRSRAQASVALMKAQSYANAKTGDRVELQGYYARGDGGGGQLYVDKADTTTADNGVTVFVASDGTRLKRPSCKITSLQAGAVGNDSTDDTARLQSALSCGASEVDFVKTSSKYKITNTLTAAANCKICSSSGAVIHQTANNKKSLLISGISGVTVEGITFEGKGSTDTASVANGGGGLAFGVHVTNSDNIRIKNCKVLYHKNNGIIVDSTDNYWIEDNVIQGTGPDASLPNGDISVNQTCLCVGELGDGIDSVDYFGVTITGNKCSYSHQGILAGPSLGDVKLNDNSFTNMSNHGGYIYPGYDWTVDNNYFADNNDQGFKLQWYANSNTNDLYVPKNLTFSNNIIKNVNSGNWGFGASVLDVMSGSNSIKSKRRYVGLKIINNTIVPKSGGRGIVVQHAKDSEISGNIIRRCELGIFTINFGGSIFDNTIYGDNATPITAFAPFDDCTTIKGNKVFGGCSTSGNYFSLNQFNGFVQWGASTVYVVDDIIYNGANTYICKTSGTSASSGGPTGTGTAIVDGTVVWDFNGTIASFSGGKIILNNNIALASAADAPGYSVYAGDATLTLEMRGNTIPSKHGDGTTDVNAYVTAAITAFDDNAYGGLVAAPLPAYTATTQGRPGRDFWGTAAPVAGTWIVGDRVWHLAPASGGVLLWVCTTAGTPGTWKAIAIP